MTLAQHQLAARQARRQWDALKAKQDADARATRRAGATKSPGG
jgi:hypothetical protein